MEHEVLRVMPVDARLGSQLFRDFCSALSLPLGGHHLSGSSTQEWQPRNTDGTRHRVFMLTFLPRSSLRFQRTVLSCPYRSHADLHNRLEPEFVVLV